MSYVDLGFIAAFLPSAALVCFSRSEISNNLTVERVLNMYLMNKICAWKMWMPMFVWKDKFGLCNYSFQSQRFYLDFAEGK